MAPTPMRDSEPHSTENPKVLMRSSRKSSIGRV